MDDIKYNISQLKKACKKDFINIISPYNLGDTFMLCAFSKAYEQKTNQKIHFIIKPFHEVILKMFGIENYTMMGINEQACVCLAETYPVWKKGIPCIGHYFFYNQNERVNFENKGAYHFSNLFRWLYGLDETVEPEKPSWYPKISRELTAILKGIAPLDKIVLFCPEANTSFPLSARFWQKLAKTYKRKGYTIITNAVNPKNQIKGTICFDMSLSDIIALSMHCAKVEALRSGFTDLIFAKGKDLTVYYTTLMTMSGRKSLFVFSLNKVWHTSVHEVVKAAYRRSNKELYLCGFPIKYTISTCSLSPYVKTWYFLGIPYKWEKFCEGGKVRTYFGLLNKITRRKA